MIMILFASLCTEGYSCFIFISVLQALTFDFIFFRMGRLELFTIKWHNEFM